MELEFRATLWVYPGAVGWHFVTVPLDLADEIRLVTGEPRGFGSVRVEVRVGNSRWRTSVFPDKARGSYVLPMKKPVRVAEDLDDGDLVTVRLRVLDN